MQKAKDFQIGPKDVKERKPIHELLGKLIWLISAARNIIVVVVSAIAAYLFEAHGASPFILTGESLQIQKFYIVTCFILKVL